MDLVTEENMFEQCKKTHAILMGKLASLDTDTAIASKGKMFGEAVKKENKAVFGDLKRLAERAKDFFVAKKASLVQVKAMLTSAAEAVKKTCNHQSLIKKLS